MNTNHLADAPIVTAKDAISRHMQWKITLQLAIALNEPLSPNAIRAIQHSEECPIGRWLVSQHTSCLRNTPEYRDLVARHEEFHREVAQIAAMINQGKYSAARRAIDLNSNFRKVSQAMANTITALDTHPADRNRKLIACRIQPHLSHPIRPTRASPARAVPPAL